MEDGKNCLRRCLLNQKSSNAWKMRGFFFFFFFLLLLFCASNKFLLVGRHNLITGFHKCLYSWHCKLREFGVSLHHNNYTASLQAWENRSGLPREMTMVLVFVPSIIAGWPGGGYIYAFTISTDPLTANTFAVLVQFSPQDQS